jgi:hypothetical protein
MQQNTSASTSSHLQTAVAAASPSPAVTSCCCHHLTPDPAAAVHVKPHVKQRTEKYKCKNDLTLARCCCCCSSFHKSCVISVTSCCRHDLTQHLAVQRSTLHADTRHHTHAPDSQHFNASSTVNPAVKTIQSSGYQGKRRRACMQHVREHTQGTATQECQKIMPGGCLIYPLC